MPRSERHDAIVRLVLVASGVLTLAWAGSLVFGFIEIWKLLG